MFCMAKVTYQ